MRKKVGRYRRQCPDQARGQLLQNQSRLFLRRPERSQRLSTARPKSLQRAPRCAWFRSQTRSYLVLVSDPNASVKVVVEISAEFPDGAKDQVKRAVSENSRSLGLKSADWE